MWVPGIEFKLSASVVQIHLGSLLPVSLTLNIYCLNIYCLVCVCMSGGVCTSQRTYFGSEFSLPCWDPSAHPTCSRYLFYFCSRLACIWASRYCLLLSCCRCWDYRWALPHWTLHRVLAVRVVQWLFLPRANSLAMFCLSLEAILLGTCCSKISVLLVHWLCLWHSLSCDHFAT